MIDGHGGNIYEVAGRLNCLPHDIIDMSSNVNPLGPIPDMMTHISDQLKGVTALPDASARMVSEHFADQYQLDPRHVLAGNGSTQFIYSLPLALGMRKVLILGPTYSDYADACHMHGIPHDYLFTREEEGFAPDPAGIAKLAGAYHAVFICNPNNPTGTLMAAKDLAGICRSNPDTWFIIDESYLPFVKNGDSQSVIPLALPNVLVLNSMSKIFRIPGLRVGFLIARETAVQKVARYMLPWSVNSMAQAAVEYLMTHPGTVGEFVAHTRRMLQTEREHMISRLNLRPRLHPYPSTTGFILIRLSGGLNANMVWDEMIQSRILIRNCSNFKGLSDRYIRISLKTSDMNNILIEKLSMMAE